MSIVSNHISPATEQNFRKIFQAAEAEGQKNSNNSTFNAKKVGVRPPGNYSQVKMAFEVQNRTISKALPNSRIHKSDIIETTASEKEIMSLNNYRNLTFVI